MRARSDKMRIDDNDEVAATDNFAIGISFGNSNSSIAYTSGVLSVAAPVRLLHLNCS